MIPKYHAVSGRQTDFSRFLKISQISLASAESMVYIEGVGRVTDEK